MRRGLLVLLVLAVPVVGAGPARASWSAARLVSASATEQAGAASSNVQVAAGGRYVIFRTAAGNLVADDAAPGTRHIGDILRRDMTTGALALVARGDLVDTATGDTIRFGAISPSVSADGRYVAFSTAERLVPGDTDDRYDVYVRDMSLPIGDPGAFTLVSALDGGDIKATYQPGGLGATTPAQAAISADGRTVAFVTDAASDLPAGGAGTDAGQIFVRRLDAHSTALVNVDLHGAPAGGASVIRGVGMSADGSTVAWNATNAATQAPFLDHEPTAANNAELLWRRIADGPTAPVRRVAGVGDPLDPGCPPGGAISFPNPRPSPVSSPCDGPFVAPDVGGTGGGPFALSADGRTVVFVSTAQMRGVVQVADIGADDAFIADMRDGVTRKAGVRELTRETLPTDQSISAPILAVGISADARWVALSTRRVRFALSLPTLLGTAANAVSGVETYVADRATGTMRLVTRAFDGGQAVGNEDSSRPTLTADGGEVAIQSSATNLVPGDGNSASDAFLFDRSDDDIAPLPASATPPPAPVALTPGWVLRAVARPASGGALVVQTVVPGAGRLALTVSTRPGGRTVIARKVEAGGAGTVVTALRPGAADRRRISRSGRLPVSVAVRFTPASTDRPVLSRTLLTTLRARVSAPAPAAGARR